MSIKPNPHGCGFEKYLYKTPFLSCVSNSFFDMLCGICAENQKSENKKSSKCAKKPLFLAKQAVFLTRDKGFEPLTFWSVARRSIQLS